MTSGFLTLGVWVMSGLTFSLLRYLLNIIPDDLADLLYLPGMACTPAIWIGKNQQILKDFVSYLRGDIDISPYNLENDFGGVWIGP